MANKGYALVKDIDLLITGASGYIGSALLKLATKKALNVLGIGRRPCDLPNYFRADLFDSNSVDKLNMKYNFKTILHAAASVPKNIVDFNHERFCRENSSITNNVVKIEAKNLVLISSISVYGANLHNRVSEADRSQPKSLYGISKSCAEKAILARFPGNKKILRIPGVFGGKRSGGLVFQLVNSFQTGKFGYEINNDAWSCIYIDDLVDMVVNNLAIIISSKNIIHNIAYQTPISPAIVNNELSSIFNKPEQFLDEEYKSTIYDCGDPSLKKILMNYSLKSALMRYTGLLNKK